MKRMISTFFHKVARRLRRYRNRLALLRRKLIHRPAVFEDGYQVEDNTVVTLYARREDAFPGYVPRVDPSTSRKEIAVQVSLVAVAKNEARTAQEWFRCMMSQERLPDEIVVVDTGSSDQTVTLLKQFAASCPVPFQVIESPGANISQGRNLAVRSARYPCIAVTDFGTRPRPGWLETLIFPFEHDPRTEVSGGWYDAVGQRGQPYRWRKWISLLGKNPQDILSPSVSIAFQRSAWERAGGYPEWLTLTGEDTYFDLELKRNCQYWAFCPDAMVDWEAPDSVWAYLKKMVRWSMGDGETGMRATAYWYAALVSALTFSGLCASLLFFLAGALFGLPVLLAAGALVLLLILARAALSGRRAGYTPFETALVAAILAAQAYGFLRGGSRRRAVTARRLQRAKRFYFILAGIPVDDTGGGARSTQIALELLRRQAVVIYLNIYPKSESVDLRLKIRHPNLLTCQAKDFSLADFATRYGVDFSKKEVGALIELPHADWLPLLDDLRKTGARIVYELIDEWDSNLGAGWYSPHIELQIAHAADQLTATAPLLQARLQERACRPVHLLPNAVNRLRFNPRKIYPIPPDLVHSQLVITYIGALYGVWFDWDLLAEIARSNPAASVTVIGDYRGQCPFVLPNLHFLGLKPQSELPAYLAHTHVAVIPWKVDAITRATSPLKLFEYLSMHVPVVVPDLAPLRGIPSVYLSSDPAEFLANIQRAATEPPDISRIEEFISENAWPKRVNCLVDLMGFTGAGRD